VRISAKKIGLAGVSNIRHPFSAKKEEGQEWMLAGEPESACDLGMETKGTCHEAQNKSVSP